MGPGHVLIAEIERNSGPKAVGAAGNRGSRLIIIVSGDSPSPTSTHLVTVIGPKNQVDTKVGRCRGSTLLVQRHRVR